MAPALCTTYAAEGAIFSMLQAYVLSNAALFLCYWAPMPSLCLLLLTYVHLTIFGGAQTPVIQDSLEFAVTRPAALLAGGAVAIISNHVLKKPEFVFYSREYVAKCALAAFMYAGALVSWQVAPKEFWNYIFVSALPQLIVVMISLVAIEHEEAWASTKRAKLEVHKHYAVYWLLLNVFHIVGQLARPDLPTYLWTVGFLGTSMLWIYVHILVIDRALPVGVTARALVIVRAADGSLEDPRWRADEGSDPSATPRPAQIPR